MCCEEIIHNFADLLLKLTQTVRQEHELAGESWKMSGDGLQFSADASQEF